MTQDQDSWPPPSTSPNPLAEYDDVLTTLIEDHRDRTLSSRLSLAVALQKETKLALKLCHIYVDFYCDTRGLMPHTRQFRNTAILVLAVSNSFMLAVFEVVKIGIHSRYNAAHTSAQRIAISNFAQGFYSLYIALTLLIVLLTFWLTLIRRVALRHQTGEQVRKR